MTRMFAGMISAMLIASPAAANVPNHFDVAPVSETELSGTFGTGGPDKNFRLVLDDKASSDRDLFANASHDAMDGWWAYTGAVLIAASLRN